MMTSIDLSDSIHQILFGQFDILGVNHIIQVLFLGDFLHLHKLHHPIQESHFFIRNALWNLTGFLSQKLFHGLSVGNVCWRLWVFQFGCVLFEVFLDHRFVLLDWGVLQLIQIGLCLKNSILVAQFGLSVLVRVTSEVL